MAYIGNQPGTGVRSRFIYTATASQTTFSGADNNSKTLKYADSDYIDVFLNGVCLVPGTDYTASTKTSVVLTQAASVSDTLEVVAYDIATISDTVSKADGGTFDGNVGFGTAPERQVHIAGNPAIMLMEDTGGGTNDKKVQVQVDSGVFEINSRNDDLSSQTDNIMCMEIDTGKVGIGTNSPSAGLHTIVDNNPVAEFSRGSNNTTNINLDYNATLTGQISAANAQFQVSAVGSSTPLEFFANGAERMRITDDGKVGVGTSAPDTPLHVEGASGSQFVVEATSGQFAQQDFKIAGAQKGAIWVDEATDLMGYYTPSGWGKNFYTGGSERMRITDDGKVLVGKTSSSASANSGVELHQGGPIFSTFTSGTTYHMHNTSSYGFYVNANGGIYNYQSNNVNLSDQREKKNIEALGSKWDAVKAWSLKEFHYNVDEDSDAKKLGVIAQDIESDHPDLVTEFLHNSAVDEVKDEDGNVTTEAVDAVTRKAVKEQQMMWMAIKALQEAIAKIETLETKVAALEAG